MSDPNASRATEKNDEWFFWMEQLDKFGMAALVVAATAAGGFMLGVSVLALIIGLYIGGRIGTGIIGALVGFLLGGSLVGMGIGISIGVFNAWIYEIESHRRRGDVIRQLGMINGFLIGVLMSSQLGASGLQLLLGVAIYTFIGRFVAEAVPGFMRFMASLDQDDDEEETA